MLQPFAQLPEPSPEALAHSAEVRRLIARRIRESDGWIPFSEFMDLALYAPGLGYYSAGARKFGGEGGDFVTAPEISELFSQVVATQIGELLAGLGPEASILELGPGTGRFARETLRTLAAAGRAPAEYLLLEVSADLRERQQQMLTEYVAEAGSHSRTRVRCISELPKDFTGVIFGNEVVDALPCERFVMHEGRAQRVGVILQSQPDGSEAFGWGARDADGEREGDAEFNSALNSHVGAARLALLEDGYCSELRPQVGAWVESLGACFAARGGTVLLFDYGMLADHYYHPQRATGTLRCHYRHRAHEDPFSYPGLTDITAWVDFSALGEAAEASGFEVTHFATQAEFLTRGGIERFYAAASEGTVASNAAASQALQTLLLPGQMGESVKAIQLTQRTRS